MDKVKNRISIDRIDNCDGRLTYGVDQVVDDKLRDYGEFDKYSEAKRVALRLGREMKVEVWDFCGNIWTPSGNVCHSSR